MENKDEKTVTMPMGEFYRLSQIDEDYHKIKAEQSNIVIIRQWIGTTIRYDSPVIFTRDEAISEINDHLKKSIDKANLAEQNYRKILDSHYLLVNKVMDSFFGRILFRKFIIKTTK